jgi:hypothetical protein
LELIQTPALILLESKVEESEKFKESGDDHWRRGMMMRKEVMPKSRCSVNRCERESLVVVIEDPMESKEERTMSQKSKRFHRIIMFSVLLLAGWTAGSA